MSDIHELAALYVVDALTPEEILDFERHLVDCAACQEEVTEMRSVTEHLSRSAEAEPPLSLRASVLAGIGATAQEQSLPAQEQSPTAQEQAAQDRPDNIIVLPQRRPSRLPYLVAAASVLLALGFGGWALQNRDDANQASSQQAQILQVLGAPDVRTVTATAAGGASGTVVVSRASNQAFFVASGMPDLPDGKVYELWTIEGPPEPAGTFTSTDSAALVALPQSALSAERIAVTVEPSGGSDHPTSDPVMRLSLT